MREGRYWEGRVARRRAIPVERGTLQGEAFAENYHERGERVNEIIAVLITGGLTLAGVIISNQRTQAVTEAKLEELTREVREHNHFARRMPVVEEQIRVLSHRIGDLESYHKGAAGAAGDRKEKGL